VSDKPTAYLLDSPGVMVPQVKSLEEGLKLALIAALRDSIVSPQILAEYLLFLFNERIQTDAYVRALKLERPTTNIQELLERIAHRLGLKQVGHSFDLDAAAKVFLQRYRSGELGRYTLDTVAAPEEEAAT